jgi:hypothetical protein
MRHSASLTELGRHGEWPRVRQELISTQTDVEQAMVELRDEKMAHLISLGGWLRGLEICARVVEMDFSAQRAKILAQSPSTLTHADVSAIRIHASELNDTIRQGQ